MNQATCNLSEVLLTTVPVGLVVNDLLQCDAPLRLATGDFLFLDNLPFKGVRPRREWFKHQINLPAWIAFASLARLVHESVWQLLD